VFLANLRELCDLRDLRDLCVKFCAGFCFTYSLQQKEKAPIFTGAAR
jgi:hypothetical protein